jgi:hypothetical protein
MKLIKILAFCTLLLLFSGCSNTNSTKQVINNPGSSQVGTIQKDDKALTQDEALVIAKKSFGENFEYKYLDKIKINGIEYYSFRWGSNEGEHDSRVCIEVSSGKAYLQYVDGKFVDFETYQKNLKK